MGYKEELQKVHGRLDWLAKRLDTADVVEARPKNWVRRHQLAVSLAVAITAVMVAVAAWIQPQLSRHREQDLDTQMKEQVAAQLKDPITRLSAIAVDIAEMKGKLAVLDPLIHDLIKKQFEKAAAAPLRELEGDLPLVRAATAAARAEGVRISPRIVSAVSHKLLQLPDRGDQFWQVGGELISYRSAVELTGVAIESAIEKMPKCTDSPVNPMTLGQDVHPSKTPQTVKYNPAYYENCRLALDSPEDAQKINAALMLFFDVVCKHCVVVYAGGPINISIPPGRALKFDNCLLQFTLRGAPAPRGRQLTAQLLAASTNTFKLPPS